MLGSNSPQFTDSCRIRLRINAPSTAYKHTNPTEARELTDSRSKLGGKRHRAGDGEEEEEKMMRSESGVGTEGVVAKFSHQPTHQKLGFFQRLFC